MAILSILKFPDPTLKKVSLPVENITGDTVRLVQDIVETMYAAPGVGLAAPQMGKLQRIIVIDIDYENPGKNLIKLVNPEIRRAEGELIWEEGCLSVPETTVIIKRPQKIKIKYTDEENEVIENEFDDLTARVLLHEIDHLDGKLIVDYKDLEENKEPHKKKAKDSPL